MSEEKKKRKPLSLQLTPSPASTPERIRQNLSHGRSKSVMVEVKKKRSGTGFYERDDRDAHHVKLTDQEQSLRWKAVQDSLERKKQEEEEAAAQAQRDAERKQEEQKREAERIQALAREEEERNQYIPAHNDTMEEIKKPQRKELPFSSPDRTYSYTSSNNAAGSQERNYKNKKKSVVLTKKGERFHKPDQEEKSWSGRKFKKGGAQKKKSGPVVSQHKTIDIHHAITVTELALKISQKASVLIKAIQKMGDRVDADSVLDTHTAQIICEEMGYVARIIEDVNKEEVLWNKKGTHSAPRPPVVTIMGHVNHGKTSLLDALRKTNVVKGEAGGITQHIGSYQVCLPSGKVITFIDTPGHQAFTEMRARGAQVTDMVVLVVAADEGPNEQTVEAIRHCQAAQVPMIVAINKIDKPGANPDQVRQKLLMHDVVVEKMGGEIQDVEISALKGINLESLEEAILLQGELLGLEADPSIPAKGIVLETHVKKGYGVVATVLVQAGTLKKSDFFVAGTSFGKVKLLFNDQGNSIASASVSQPVQVIGFSDLPASGDRFLVVSSEAEAKEIVTWKKTALYYESGISQGHMISDYSALTKHLDAQHTNEARFIVKADTQGSMEGLIHELMKITHSEISIKVVHKGVGNVNESDILLAQATQATVLCFNVSILPEAKKLVSLHHTVVLQDTVIYHITEQVERIVSGLLEPLYEDSLLGKAEVLRTFSFGKSVVIAGCIVREGLIRRNAYVRVIRKGNILFEGLMKSLKQQKDDVKERSVGHECGVVIEGYHDFMAGDILECFEKKSVERKV